MACRNKRLMRDIADFYNQGEQPVFTVTGFKDDLSRIQVRIKGSDESPFAGGWFDVDFEIPEDFPYSPPLIYFKTKVWHPNISLLGTVCMNILDVNWRPAISIIEFAEALRTLLISPNALSPMNSDAAQFMLHNEELYNQTCVMWTNEFAGGSTTVPELEEKIEILMGLGLTRKAALKKGTENEWDMEKATSGL